MDLKLPSPINSRKFATVPVAAEDDLITAIQADPLGSGDDSSFDLSEDIDVERIQAFLNEALSDMDPTEQEAAKS